MILKVFGFTCLLLSAAIFGFFYAWVCSTMWGLDAIDPGVAIQAMQGMNASVRNGVFAVSFFGTSALLGVMTVYVILLRAWGLSLIYGVALLISVFGGVVLTMVIHVPMNEALALVSVPSDAQAARNIWEDFSGRWQVWNQIRTGFTGLVVVLCGYGLAQVYRIESA